MGIDLELEQQVIGIKLAIKLKRLGVRQGSYFVWYKEELLSRNNLPDNLDVNDVFAAFTSQELGWMLPKGAECDGIKFYLGMDKLNEDWEIWYENSDGVKWKDCYMGTNNEAHNRGYILSVLLENGAIPN